MGIYTSMGMRERKTAQTRRTSKPTAFLFNLVFLHLSLTDKPEPDYSHPMGLINAEVSVASVRQFNDHSQKKNTVTFG